MSALQRHKDDCNNLAEQQNGHEARFRKMVNPDGTVLFMLDWRNPKSTINCCCFVIRHSTLMVYGDLGDAVYRWSDVISFQWLAGLGMGYFAEKCLASDTGRGGREWDSELMAERLWQHLMENVPEDQNPAEWAGKLIERERGVSVHNVVSLMKAWLRSECDDPHSCGTMLNEMPELFGSDSWELCDLGYRPSTQVLCHLLSLRYAWQRVGTPAWASYGRVARANALMAVFTPDANPPQYKPRYSDDERSGWVLTEIPAWLKEPDHEKAAEDAPGGGRAGAGNTGTPAVGRRGKAKRSR
jgi:hypothetical protein